MLHDLRDLPTAVRFAMSVSNKNRKELGFLPTAAYGRAHDQGRLLIQHYNGQPCGFLIHGPHAQEHTTHIYQCAIEIDARRLRAATAVVTRLIADARSSGARRLRLRCSIGIDANAFWRSCGFELVAYKPGSPHRKNTLAVYELTLLPELF